MRLKDFGTRSWFSSFTSDTRKSMVQMTLRLLYKSIQITQIVICCGIIVIQQPCAIYLPIPSVPISDLPVQFCVHQPVNCIVIVGQTHGPVSMTTLMNFGPLAQQGLCMCQI